MNRAGMARAWVAATLLAGCAGLPQAPGGLPEGISYSRVDGVTEVAQSIHVLTLDLARVSLEVTAADFPATGEYRARTTSEYARHNRLHAAVNGGFFEPFKGGTLAGDDYYPKAGELARVVVPKAAAVLCIRMPATATIERGSTCPSGTDHELVAGPLLLRDGEPQPNLQLARHPRTAMGLSADRRTAWLVVVDGRQAMSAGATLPEMAEIFRHLGASDAINFDGGGSSAMVVAEGAGLRLANSPIHTLVPGRERPVPNHLGVRAR